MTVESGPRGSGGQRPGTRRAGVVLVVALVVLVALAVVAAVLAATRTGPQLPSGSPEATVQDYLQLVHDHDLDGAAGLLDPDRGCTVDDLEQAYVERDARMVLRDSDVRGDRATVRIEIVRGSGGPFGVDTWTSEERFDLVRDGDRWVITGEPWPMYTCSSPGKERR